MSNTVVLCNPSAGGAEISNDVIARMARRHQCDLRLPARESDLEALARSVAAQGASRIIVAGGDGTISRVVNALLPEFSRVELGILPLGTGNDLARSLDLPLDDLEMAFDLAATRRAIRLDVAHVQRGVDTYFINAATGGFGGEVTAALTADNKQTWGAFAYWLTAMSRLVDLHTFAVRLSLDGELIEQTVYGIGVANGRYVGGGFPIAGLAKLNDGLLDVLVVPELPALELLSSGLNYMLGRSPEGTSLVVRRAARVEVHAQPAMPFSLDGEAVHAFDALFEVVPGALLVVAGDNPEAL